LSLAAGSRPGPRTAPAYDVAQDGKPIPRHGAGQASRSRVALVVNWTAELKK